MARLAQPQDEMFERNISLIASRASEVQIYSDSFVYEGFVCGLDDVWVQIYGHEENNKGNPETEWRFVLVNRDNISAIGTTGRYISDLDEKTRDYVNRKIKTFVNACDKFQSVREQENDSKREKAGSSSKGLR